MAWWVLNVPGADDSGKGDDFRWEEKEKMPGEWLFRSFHLR